MSDTFKRVLELDEIYQEAFASRDPLVSRLAGHNLPTVTTSAPKGTVRSNVDQLVTAALIEAYRLGASETRAEADAIAQARFGYQIDAALRVFDNACADVRKALKGEKSK